MTFRGKFVVENDIYIKAIDCLFIANHVAQIENSIGSCVHLRYFFIFHEKFTR